MTDKSHVLEFRLGSTDYCIGIEYIEEVVETESDEITDLPNSAPHIKGLMDLRGETTTIIDPKKLLGIHEENGSNKIIVLENEQEEDVIAGWLVDEVNEVSIVPDETVETPGEDTQLVKGVVNRGDEFVIWVEP